MFNEIRPFAYLTDSRLIAMVEACEVCSGIQHAEKINLQYELDYRTDTAKQAAIAILDNAENSCLRISLLKSTAQFGYIYIDAADFLARATAYLVNPCYHERRDSSSNRLYGTMQNQSIT